MAVKLAVLTPEERAEALTGLPEELIAAMLARWEFERRLAQTAPLGRWSLWAVKGGRGSGKTRTAGEFVTDRIQAGSTWNHLLSRTHADVRDVMINGESGLIEIAHARGIEAVYESSKRRVWYPDYKAQALMFGAQDPDEVRGPQCETGWADEFSIYPKKRDSVGNTALTNFLFGARLGDDPRVVVTFTPKPTQSVKELLARCLDPLDFHAVMTEMTLYDNIANLPESYIAQVFNTFRGTRLEAQEVLGIYTDAVEGALWTTELLDRQRVDDAPILSRVYVGVDPPGNQSAECGIIVAGVEQTNSLRKSCYVLADHSMRGTPEEWGHKVIEALRLHGGTAIVAEANQGHDMVRAVIHAIDPDVKVMKVYAHEGKRARAEPVELLYEAGRVWHVGHLEGFQLLEAQQSGWVPDPEPGEGEQDSPDRMDALVWVVTELMGMMNRKPGRSSSPADLRIPKFGG